MRRVGWWAVAGVVVLAACRQLVGIGDTPPGASSAAGDDASAADGTGFDDTGACGPALATGACEACMQAHCCSRAAACAGYEPCNHLETCLAACNGDAPCRAQCGARYGLGNDTATPPLEACLANVCSGECGMPCGGMAALFPPASAAACESCIENGPRSAVTACATDEACQAAVRCQLAAQTVDVDEACAAVGDAGTIAVAVEEFPPIASACGNECSWGGDWSCLGKVSFPAPTYGAIQIEVNVASAAFATPVSGEASLEPQGDRGTHRGHRSRATTLGRPEGRPAPAQPDLNLRLLVEAEGSALQRVEAENQGQAVEDLTNPRGCELAHPLGQPLPVHSPELRDVDDAGAGQACLSLS